MQAQYVVTPKLKNYLLECYPEKAKDIYGNDINFLFNAPYAIDFPKTESRSRVKQFKSRLQELLYFKKEGIWSKKDEKELKQMMVSLYVYELTKANSYDFEDTNYAVFVYAPPLFDIQKEVIEYRMQNKEIFNKIHKYYYKTYYHNSIFARQKLTEITNPALYTTMFKKTHISNDESFDLLGLPKVAVPNTHNTKGCSYDPNVTYESEYYTGNYKGNQVLFYKQIVRTKDVIGTTGEKIEKINVTLAICINGNPSKRVCLLRYDYNPTDPHINRVYYAKDTNQLTINTTTNEGFRAELAYQKKNNQNSHLHKYDENVAYLFPSKSAENMAENMIKKFNSGYEVIEWFDKVCNIGKTITPAQAVLEK